MVGLRRVGVVVAVAVSILAVGGVAFALVDDDSMPGAAPATVTLTQGKASSGSDYTISRVADVTESGLFCYEFSTGMGVAQTCSKITGPNEKFDGRVSRAIIGTDRFISIVVPSGVESMLVATPGRESVQARSVTANGGNRLLVATIDGPPATSRTPEPDRTVQFLDDDGKVVLEAPLTGTD